MELCSLEEAYSPPKDMASFLPKVGCTDTKPSREERRAARKKSKKCKGPAETYLEAKEEPPIPETDPDRPAVKRMGEVPAFTAVGEAFPDLSGSEGFRLPRLPPSSCSFSDAGLPAYFGKGLDDADEGFQDYNGIGGLIPQTLEGGFEGQGVSKAGSGGSAALPAPPLIDAWKPLGSAGAPTAFAPSLLSAPAGRVVESTIPASGPTVGPYGPKQQDPTKPPSHLPKELLPSAYPPSKANECETSRDILLSKLQELTRRLDLLEKGGESSKHPRQEVLLFVGAGIGVLISLDLIVRAAR